MAKTSGTALKALESGNIPKAKEEFNKGISLINARQKIIKLADKSEFGWAIVLTLSLTGWIFRQAKKLSLLAGVTAFLATRILALECSP